MVEVLEKISGHDYRGDVSFDKHAWYDSEPT